MGHRPAHLQRAPVSPGSILAPQPTPGDAFGASPWQQHPAPGSSTQPCNPSQHPLPRCEAPLCSNISLPGFLTFYLSVVGAFFPPPLFTIFLFSLSVSILPVGPGEAVPFPADHPDTVAPVRAAVGRRGNKWEVQGKKWHRCQMLQQGNTRGPCDLSLLCGRGCCAPPAPQPCT